MCFFVIVLYNIKKIGSNIVVLKIKLLPVMSDSVCVPVKVHWVLVKAPLQNPASWQCSWESSKGRLRCLPRPQLHRRSGKCSWHLWLRQPGLAHWQTLFLLCVSMALLNKYVTFFNALMIYIIFFLYIFTRGELISRWVSFPYHFL